VVLDESAGQRSPGSLHCASASRLAAAKVASFSPQGSLKAPDVGQDLLVGQRSCAVGTIPLGVVTRWTRLEHDGRYGLAKCWHGRR
jgi:hypothetical protein